MDIKVKRLNSNAILPTRAHNSDAGLDLYFNGDTDRGRAVGLHTGIAVDIPDGYVGLIWPRSGLTVKTGYDTLAGVIDAGYHGEIIVLCDRSFRAKQGDKIAQLVIVPCVNGGVVEVQDFDDSERGDNGFGSTGK